MRGSFYFFYIIMLMFQNGLLATFIPEILMVLGYILCLITPGLKPDNSAIQQTQLVVNVSSNEYHQIAVNQFIYTDFQTYPEFVAEEKKTPLPFITKAINITSESNFSTSDGLSYVDFSRPPPTILI